jgi:hypothetical protein
MVADASWRLQHDLGETELYFSLCSNRAATRVNLLKVWEKRQRKNTAVCGSFAGSRNLWQTIALNSHGRDRWFEPSIAHSGKAPLCRYIFNH